MTSIVEDFNELYTRMQRDHNLTLCLTCSEPDSRVCMQQLQERRSYFCCAVDSSRDQCVLHNCVVVVLGTWLDKLLRNGEPCDEFEGTFVVDGRHFSFPNIMMNNNILVHNFFDKQYPREKNMRRMFLYGNYDDEKNVNRAIQLVYDRIDDVLYVRDVYAKDYIVDESINPVLREYLNSSGRWYDMDFMFEFTDEADLFSMLKRIMSVDIDYTIDSLSNKIIYKHAYLLELTYQPLLTRHANVEASSTTTSSSSGSSGRKTAAPTVVYATECKKCHDIIVAGKLIQSVSKTLSKQKRFDQEYNSNNNNVETSPLKHRIGSEVLRIVNENLQQEMLKHTSDYVKFVDSFFHGEMTVAGKKFFLCKKVALPTLDYGVVRCVVKRLIDAGLFFDAKKDGTDPTEKCFFDRKKVVGSVPCSDVIKDGTDPTGSADLKLNRNVGSVPSFERHLLVCFNNRPTKYYCRSADIHRIYYYLKRQYTPVEIKHMGDMLFINHHEGMIMLRCVVRIGGEVRINTLQTPYEYHNAKSVVRSHPHLFRLEDDRDTVVSLTSALVQNYYADFMHIFATLPVAKLIVNLTNLKNGMVVQSAPVDVKRLPIGNSVVVAPSVLCNDRMFKLWTVVRDRALRTAEDPYIPHHRLPIQVYHNRIHKLKGKCEQKDRIVVDYRPNQAEHALINVSCDHSLCLFGTLVSSSKISWNHDGKKYKIEYCQSKNHHVYKFYMYVRRVRDQVFDIVDSELSTCEEGGVFMRLRVVFHTTELEGLKICGIHGQKGVLNGSEDLSRYEADDGSGVHAQICLSPISYLSRQSNFDRMPTKYCRTEDGRRVPLIEIPYMFFNNTPDNIYKEFNGANITGYEKVEGTRLDQWSINQSFMGNRLAEGLHCVRNGTNSFHTSGQYNVFKSLIHCNNIYVQEPDNE
uniref:Late expression factor-8 n=1 Tax=Achaea janata granulovirus TaxID=262174 RepID=L0BUC9_9BBAC|nr:late expression factor-8 [Achaea janata granulovirus]